jgi:hypothetical protein
MVRVLVNDKGIDHALRAAVAGAFLTLAVPKVRRMPRTVALTNSSSVGVAKPANLWAYLIAAVRRPISRL